MNTLAEVYRTRIRPSIVAFVAKYEELESPDAKPAPFPHIIGTGFVVREDGVIATNAHVVQAIKKAFRPPDVPVTEWCVYALLFWLTDRGMVEVRLDVLGVAEIGGFHPGSVDYFNKQRPDLAFVQVKAKEMPALVVNAKAVYEGTDVCTAGFPMGSDALAAPGWMHQATPTLQKGIVSAVLPFASEFPYAYSINIMTQAGASGSPIFLPESGEVIGILYGGLNEFGIAKSEKFALRYPMPTNISFACPSHYIEMMMSTLGFRDLPAGTQSIPKMLEAGELVDGSNVARQYTVKSVVKPQ